MSDEEKRWPFDGFYLKLAEAQREYEQEQHIDPALLTEEERQQKLQEILDCIKASRKKKKEADEQLDPIVPEEEPETAGATPQPTKQYITDLVGEDYKNWHGIVVLDAGTNSGKTYFILKTLLPWTYEHRKRILILCNREALRNQYVSRILLPVGVGKVASAQNIASYFVTAAALGLPSYGVREFAKVREDTAKKNSLFTELFIINLISTTISLIAYIFVLILNNGFNGEGALYICCGLAIFFNYLNIDWIYQGLEEYGYITGRSVVIKCISLALLVVFVKTREDYVAYALLTSLALGGNYIFNVIHARKMVGFTLVNLKIRKHIKPIVFIAGIIFMSTIYNKIDITMLSALSTDEAVGYYSYAQRTVNIVLTMCSAVTAIFLPRLSYYYDNEKAVFYKLMDKGFQILCLGVVPLAVGLFLTANQAVVLLYGDSFTPTGTTIKLMCPLILIKGFGDLLCYQLAYSSKNEYILLPGSAIASIINVITNSILIPLYAQNGAVIASVMSELTTNIIQFLYLKRKIKYHISNTALVLSLFSTMVMAAVVCAIIKMNLPLAVALAMEISIGGAIYLLMNIALKNRILSEMLTKVLKKHNTGFQDS